MIRNENGFTYPLTLSLLIVFLLFFSVRVELLLTERKFIHDTQTTYLQEYYMLTTEKKIEKLLKSGGSNALPVNGTYTYREGVMEYIADPPVGSSQRIAFTLHLNSGEVTRSYGYFDIQNNTILKWIEKN